MTLARARLEALLLLVLSALLASFLWLSRGSASSAEREGREAHLFPTFEPARLRKLVIESGELGQAAVVLRRNPAGADLHDYRLGESPGPGISPPAADRAEVAGLLRTLDFATFLRTMSQSEVPEVALGQPGPKLKLEVEMDSVSYRVTIGGAAQHPAGARYARTTGDDGTDRVGIVPESLVVALDKDARELLGRLLFPHAKSQTKALVIERETSQTKLLSDALGFRVTQAASGKESTKLEEARDVRADPSRVDGLFFQLARAGMDAYPTATSSERRPLLVVQVPESGPEVRVEIGGECAGHPELVQAVRTAPDRLAGCTNSSLLDVLLPRDLTLRGPWSLAPDEIDHIVITRAETSLDLIRDGAAFRLLSPTPGPLSLERGNEYLEDLSKLVLEAAPCRGEVQGNVRVVGHPEGSPGGRELELGLLGGDGAPLLRRQDDGTCLVLTDHASWLLDPNASWYDSLEVLSVRPDDVLSLHSSGPKLGSESVHRQDGVLVLRGGAVDEALLDEALHALSPLRAQRIASQRNAAPWQTQLEVRIEARGAGPFTLRIGPRVRGGYLAALAGRRTEFILSPDVVRTLETSLVSRAPAQWNPEAFTELSVSARGVTYRLRRIGGELVPVDDSPPELGPALAQALSALIPVSAVRAGGPAPELLGPAADLELDGLYDRGDAAPPRRLTVKLGAQVLYAERAMQLMTIGDDPQAYYVDRAAVLSVLDLL